MIQRINKKWVVITFFILIMMFVPMSVKKYSKAITHTVASEYDFLSSDIKNNCVLFARYKVPSLPYRLNNLQDKKNIINSNTPQVGAIAITSGNSTYGHVAYVEAVNGSQITTLNGGYTDRDGNFTGHIERYTGTASELGVYGYWVPGDVVREHNPIGVIDYCISKESGKIEIGGWVFDEDDISKSVDIHVYIGADDANSIGYNLGAANSERNDVNNVYHCGGNHGISKTIAVSADKTGRQRVRIFAVNIGGGGNTLLFDSEIDILQDHNPFGTIEYCGSKISGIIEIGGWVFDEDDISKSVDIHVYIGADDANSIGYNLGAANSERDDVNNVYHCGANHGISKTIAVSADKTGRQRVRIFAINVGGGGDTLLFDEEINILALTVPNSSTDTIKTPISNPAPKPNLLPGKGLKGDKEQFITTKKIKTYKFKNLKKRGKIFFLGAVTNGKGKIVYKNTTSKRLRKYISVSPNGKVTIKKGAKKGTYQITIIATKTSDWKRGEKIIKIKIK